MPETFLQKDRFLFVETPPLGRSSLVLDSYTGREAISELFSFQLELLSEDQSIDFASLLGKKICFGVAGERAEEKRQIRGVVTAFAQLPSRERIAHYRATVSPTIWRLTLKRQSRIFQNLSVPDTLKKVLEGFDVDYDLRRPYHPREYCVQYRESDFDFVSRIMEEEGIFYFFKHSGEGDQLVVADTPVSHVDIPGNSRIVYDELEGAGLIEPRIFDWQKTQRWESGKYTLWDQCFELPHNNLQAQKEILPDVYVGKVNHELNVRGIASELEVYDYPGGYAKHFECGPGDVSQIFDENNRAAGNGMERIEAAQFVIRGRSNVSAFIPGYRFALERHFNGDGQYVITSVTHSAREGAFFSGIEAEQGTHFSNTFTCLPLVLPFRPACSTPKPQVRGCQIAYVVGPDGEDIYTDKYGRVKILFPWDREGKGDGSCSCWVRVASSWAGKGWGAIHLPRITQEVVIDFLEGDPDRPIVVGSVYNANNMPPYALPDNRTQSTVKSRSSKGGGTDNFNEIRFEDKMGSEEVFFQAEKDLNSLVKNDETRTVKHDRKVTIENDDSKDVTHDLKLTVGNNRTTSIASNDSTTIGKNQTQTVGSNSTVSIGSNNSETVGGSESITIGGSQTATIGGSESHTAASRTTTIMGADSTTVAGSVTLTAGGGLTITSGGPITITAPMINLTAPMVQAVGVIQCMTLIAAAGVVSPMYTPGVGNIL